MKRLRRVWRLINDSLWFVPALLVCFGVALAVGLVEAQALIQHDLSMNWPRVFGVGAEGARGMLTAIATSMATVAGVVFSITIVALSLAASQYSPRVLRNFMADRPTQVVLGAFLAIFAYCLIVLRTIRAEADGPFVPSLAVLGGVLMAFIGIALLIYFIHHVAVSIQVPYILERISRETKLGMDHLFPSQLGEELEEAAHAGPPQLPDEARSLEVMEDAYLVGVDGDGLLAEACRMDRFVRVVPRVGDFVTAGELLIQVSGSQDLDKAACRRLHGCFSWQGERNVHQDVQYGLQQLVDVALKALSPSTHDPTTAVLCIDHIGALLKRLSSRHMESSWRVAGGQARLWVQGRSYEELVATALSAITQHAAGHVPVHARLIAAVERAASATADPQRRSILIHRLQEHLECLSSCEMPKAERERLVARVSELRVALAGPLAVS